MVVPIWFVIVAILIAAFPVYWKVLDGKNIKQYDDYIPVLAEITGYLLGVLVVMTACMFTYAIGSVLWLLVSEICKADWSGMLNHEVIYIK